MFYLNSNLNLAQPRTRLEPLWGRIDDNDRALVEKYIQEGSRLKDSGSPIAFQKDGRLGEYDPDTGTVNVCVSKAAKLIRKRGPEYLTYMLEHENRHAVHYEMRDPRWRDESHIEARTAETLYRKDATAFDAMSRYYREQLMIGGNKDVEDAINDLHKTNRQVHDALVG